MYKWPTFKNLPRSEAFWKKEFERQELWILYKHLQSLAGSMTDALRGEDEGN